MPRSLVEQKFAAAAKGYVTSEVHAKGESLARLVELTAPAPDWRALDVATGAGHVALALAPRVAHVIAADLTQEMLDEAVTLAGTRGITNIEFVRAPAELLPFPEASFDLVTSRIAPHHFNDVEAFVREVARVLKPGGTFGLVDNVGPDRELLPGLSDAEISQADAEYTTFEKARDPSHNRALPLLEWLDLISRAGLAVKHSERLLKAIDLDTWARRMGADRTMLARLVRILDDPSPALAAFLEPANEAGKRGFTLHEGLVVASKP